MQIKIVVAIVVFISCLVFLALYMFSPQAQGMKDSFPLVIVTGVCLWGIIYSIRLFKGHKQ